jgi:hypothetical protein
MPRPKKLVSELLESAVAPNVITARRPDLPITREMAEAIGEAVKAKSGELILPLPAAVKHFSLSSTYADTKRAQLLASSLYRKMIAYNIPVKVGARDHGKYLVFSQMEDREFNVMRGKQKVLDVKED